MKAQMRLYKTTLGYRLITSLSRDIQADWSLYRLNYKLFCQYNRLVPRKNNYEDGIKLLDIIRSIHK